ncbi:MAG TPA: DNA repair protein RecN [Vicinamibacteria bacterium]|nr:DNA repair protein RecN [Vicinamibacteria bacterium]
MLKLLRINNIALISSLELELRPGLVLLTGETGAGKSIVVDALGLLLGERASPELVRTGEEKASVEAVVEVGEAAGFLEERGLPVEGDELVIRREVNANGKGRASVNGTLVPVSLLRDLAPHVAAIHGQHEPQGLLDPQTHLDVLDAFAGGEGGRPLAEFHRDLRAVETALERLRGDRREAERRREMLEFQAGEIEHAGLAASEEEALRVEKARLANAGRLAAAAAEAYDLLYEDEAAALARLAQVFRRVDELAAIEPGFRAAAEARLAVLAPLEDLALRLRDYRETLEVAPGRLDEIESRLAQIERLKKKYGASVAEVLAFGERCRRELSGLGTPEEQERSLLARREELAGSYLERARVLSKLRRAAAGELRRRVQAELGELAMEKTRFEVAFAPADAETAAADASRWTERGLEQAEFLLSPNPGEDLRPLARIASGGELSRLMLALKSVAGHDALGLTLVFDEVDAGIGGRVAEVVGRKLRRLAARRQVLCVTHLPQIAAFADQHLAVRKRVTAGRTYTSVDCLSEDGRIEEVARMLGGETITETGREHAREMLKQSLRS